MSFKNVPSAFVAGMHDQIWLIQLLKQSVLFTPASTIAML